MNQNLRNHYEHFRELARTYWVIPVASISALSVVLSPLLTPENENLFLMLMEYIINLEFSVMGQSENLAIQILPRLFLVLLLLVIAQFFLAFIFLTFVSPVGLILSFAGTDNEKIESLRRKRKKYIAILLIQSPVYILYILIHTEYIVHYSVV